MAKVLIVEDDDVIAQGMARHLDAAGFDPVVVARGELGLSRLRYERPDVCVLDLMLPELDGWRLIEQARGEGIGTPIVVVSARGTEHDRVHALDLGADDYLVKPFSMKELVARVRAAARRGASPAERKTGDEIVLEELRIDPREVQAYARDFARAEIEPHAGEWDREHRFPRELFGKLAELGLMGVCVPEEYGGAGADFLSYILVLEELSRADAGVGVTVAVHTSATTLPILAFGTDEQKSRFVPPLARGDVLGAFALTEPEAGSDAGSLRTSAEPDGDGWTITGAKQWITNGGFGGPILVFARTDPDTPGARGVSAFILDADHVRITRTEEKLGLNSSVTNDIVVEGAEVGRDRLLHDEGKGFTVAMATLDGGRIGIAAQALGIAQAAYDFARNYALERRQFGKRIAEFQAIQHKLADMATEIDAARLLVYRAAGLREKGAPCNREAAMAKLFASEMANRQTAEAIQILGGYGYTKEFPVERFYRDPKITEI